MAGHLRVVRERETTPLRALIYARASKDRSGRGKSTESQVAACEADAADHEWTVVRTIRDDGRSASSYARGDRPGWQDAIDEIEAGRIDVLVVWEFSRATRKLEGYVALRTALEANGVLLCVQGDVYDLRRSRDRRRVGHDAVDAEADAGQISERVRRNKSRDAERGHPTGMVPYGYRRHYDPTTGHLVKQAPDLPSNGQEEKLVDRVWTARIVRELVDRFLAGASLNALAMDMARRGVPTPKPPRRPDAARGWTAATVGQILRSPSIAGLRQHTRDGQRSFYQAAWDPIITAAERNQILAILNDPRRVIHRGVEPTHLLSHLAVCGLCGTPVRHRVKRQKGITYPAYTCDRTGCRGVYVQAGAADNLVTQAVALVLGDPRSIALMAGDDARSTSARADAERRVVELEAELAQLNADYDARKFKASAYALALGPLQDALSEARAATTRISAGPAVMRLATSGDVAAAWSDLSVAEQRTVIRQLWEVRLHPAAVKGARRWDPSRVELLPLAR